MNVWRLLADNAKRMLYEMNSAKETKMRRYCKGNLLDCIRLVRDYSTDLVAIQLQEWRHLVSKIKRKLLLRRREVFAWEILLNLCRKVYLTSHHLFLLSEIFLMYC